MCPSWGLLLAITNYQVQGEEDFEMAPVSAAVQLQLKKRPQWEPRRRIWCPPITMQDNNKMIVVDPRHCFMGDLSHCNKKTGATFVHSYNLTVCTSLSPLRTETGLHLASDGTTPCFCKWLLKLWGRNQMTSPCMYSIGLTPGQSMDAQSVFVALGSHF